MTVDTLVNRGDNSGFFEYTFPDNPAYPTRRNLLTIPHLQVTNTANMALIDTGFNADRSYVYMPMGVYEFGGETGIDRNADQRFEAYSDGTNFYIDYAYMTNLAPSTAMNMTGRTFRFAYFNFINPGK